MRACRICMTNYDLSPLFGAPSGINFSTHQLFLVTGIKIYPNDGLPQSACRKCLRHISKAIEMREMCSKVDQMLRSIITERTAIKNEHKNFETKVFQDNFIDVESDFNTSDILTTNDCFTNESYQIKNNAKNSINVDTKSTVKFNIKKIVQSTANAKKNISNLNNNDNSKINFGEVIKAELVTTTNTQCSTENPKIKEMSPKTEINKNKREPVHIEDKINHSKTMPFNKQFSADNLTDEELASGKISDITIADLISKEALEELFKTTQICEKVSGTHSNGCEGEIRIRDKKKEVLRSIARRESQRVRDLHLMSLAATPYPRNPHDTVRCKLCNSHVQKASFKTHAKKHFAPEFACQTCGKKFHSRHHMQYHRQRKHGEQKRLACTQCSFRAVDRLALRNHERAEHTGERPFVCDECGAAFRMRNNIAQHMKMHFGVRNLQCERCPTMVKTRSELWSHQMKVHYMTYTYHCYLCPETYKATPAVRKHLLNVHGVPRELQKKIDCVKTRKDQPPVPMAGSALPTTVPQSQNQNLCHR